MENIMNSNASNKVTATVVDQPRAKRSRVLKNPQYRCSYCGEFGHNTRTCPKKAKDQAEASIQQS